MQPAGRVDQNRIAPPGLAGRDRVEHDGRGSAPSRARMMSTPARFAQISSCSTAAARNVSAAQINGAVPAAFSSWASLPTVVVFPVPLTPTISMTVGVAVDSAVGRPRQNRPDFLFDRDRAGWSPFRGARL